MKTVSDHWGHVDEHWKYVEEKLQSAHLIAWDSCHKIYLAMDLKQAVWFESFYQGKNGERTFHGTPDEMFEKVQEWWDASCGLRFVSAVWTDKENPNDGFMSLIPQFVGE
jgi:hypothetical protein